jgi:hypothetical protein
MYATAMLVQLGRDENQAKDGWENGSHEQQLLEVWYHAAKLQKSVQALDNAVAGGASAATRNEIRKAILEFAADVGNCAMIVAESTNALEMLGDPDVGERGEETVDWQVMSSGGSP